MVYPCELLEKNLGSLYECASLGDYYRIFTPLLYPDGDCIGVYCKRTPTGQSTAITDLGNTLAWLLSNYTSKRISGKHKQMMSEIASLHGVQFVDGELLAWCQDDSDLPDTVMRVAQAAMRASDIRYLFRFSEKHDSVKDVAAFLKSKEDIVTTPHYSITGDSSKQRDFHFHTRADKVQSLVLFIETSESTERYKADQAFVAWDDTLSTIKELGIDRRISLIDDSRRPVSEWEPKLLGRVSDVLFWKKDHNHNDLLKLIRTRPAA